MGIALREMASQYLQGPSDYVGNRLGIKGNSEPREKGAAMLQRGDDGGR